MGQLRLRLVSSVCLAAYLFANTHVNLALGAFSTCHPEDACAAPAEANGTTFLKCHHCALKEQIAPDQNAQKHPKKGTPCPCCPDGPLDPLCPCCPDGPGQDSCPCPGGCAMCNVAKAPCLDLLAIFAPSGVCVGASLVEEPFLHVPPFCDGLMRPPRA
jgi:hypothetical protein